MKGDRKNSREEDNKLIDNCMQGKSIYMKAKLLGPRVCFHLFLKFNSNLLWTYDNCCPNSLRPSFPIYFLQIYCLELIGPLYYTCGPQIEILQLVPFVGKTCALVSILVSVTVKYGRIRSAPSESIPGRARKLSTTRWLSQSWMWTRSGRISRGQCAYHSYELKSLSRGKSRIPNERQ